MVTCFFTSSAEHIVSTTPQETDFSDFLERLYHERKWDFRGYRKSSLRRRISLRLSAHNVSTYHDYYEILKSDPTEYDRLFSTLTVKVSEFFREPGVFELLEDVIFSRFSEAEGLRAWCCGCAFGNEAYSLGILLAECIGLKGLRSAKIFATDIDNSALNMGRSATYSEDLMQNVTDEIRDKYFFKDPAGYRVKYSIRNIARFGVLNIVKDPPISKIDILFCRNLLIYFGKDLQTKVFEKLHYALKPGGVLVLGKAEALPVWLSPLYQEVKKKSRVFIKRVSP